MAEARGKIRSDKLGLAGLTWKRVRMPNTIQYALFQAGAIPDPWYADNWKKLQWIAEHDWYLRRRFLIPDEWRGREVRLTFDGMDYTGVVWLDNRFLGVHEGMFGGPTFNITSAVSPGEHELVVRLVHEEPPTAMVKDGMSSPVMKSCAVDDCNQIWGNKFRSIGL